MNAIIDGIVSVFGYIQGLGNIVFIPLIIILIGLIFRLEWTRAIRAGLTVGIGFIGVNLILGIVWTNIGPVTKIIVERFSLNLSVLDVGWPAAAAVAFATKVGAVIIPFILVVNILMLVFRLTKTVNVDIWNYWHYAFSGSLITVITGSMLYGLIGAACHAIIALKFADITARRVQDEMGIPGISIPHGFSVAYAPLFIGIEKLCDKIPFLKHKEADDEFKVNKTAKFFTEPIIMGLIIGVILGILAGSPLAGVLQLGVNMAALMLLLPRVVKVIMEGLIPISQAAKTFLDKRFKGREFFIGLDSAVILGHPTTIAAAMILIPVTILIAIILPGNTTLPMGDLATIAFFVALATPIHKGSLVRTLISGVIVIAIILLVCSAFAPYFTQVALSTGSASGVVIPEGTAQVGSLVGGNVVAWILAQILNFKAVGIAIAVILTAATVYVCKRVEKKADAKIKSESDLSM